MSITLGECSWNPWPRLQSRCFKIPVTLVKTLARALAACRDALSSSRRLQPGAVTCSAASFVPPRGRKGRPWNFAEATAPGPSPRRRRCPGQHGACTPVEVAIEKSVQLYLNTRSWLLLTCAAAQQMGQQARQDVLCRLPGKDSSSNPRAFLCVLLYTVRVFSLLQPHTHSQMQIPRSRRRTFHFFLI